MLIQTRQSYFLQKICSIAHSITNMPLKVQYCSDLHLEMPANQMHMQKYPLQVKGDVLLMAGDIVPFSMMHNFDYFFDFISRNFKYTWWVPGNHEYYHSDISIRSGVVNEQIRENVALVNNTSIIYEDIEFIFSTLWSKINVDNAWQITRAMSDFHVIKSGEQRFNTLLFNQIHEECLNFIKHKIANPLAKKKLVITHHIPTFMNYPPKYKGDIISEAFAVEQFDLIEPSNIDAWIFGHHHYNIPEFKIGNTSMLTNQLGYVRHGENRLFDRGRILEL